ncbi:HipA N-terminal domain-containing protein [Agrobacterium tumefaciens]|jgi:serine/threonine-protein kinase HipA|uniref:HipA N-terminal domain-containing protein n=1 Tax=Agrobacterium tumefaciens TaxID=358 RepID=UPI001E290B41
MTNIYYETLPVAHLTFEGEWRLDYDPGWEARRPAFPVSLTMPLRADPWVQRSCFPGLPSCFRKPILPRVLVVPWRH